MPSSVIGNRPIQATVKRIKPRPQVTDLLPHSLDELLFLAGETVGLLRGAGVPNARDLQQRQVSVLLTHRRRQRLLSDNAGNTTVQGQR